MTFNEFVEKQRMIYDKFRDTSAIEQEGLVPRIPTQQGGYLIAFRHPEKITDSLGEFSYQSSRIVPAITYDGANAHTTISDFQVQDGFSPDSKILENLARLVYANNPFSSDVTIDYNAWLLNQSTGIAAGEPNPGFYNLAEKIVAYAQQQGTQLRLPWGAHITTNRFLKAGSPEEVRELLAFYRRSKPLGYSTPRCIDVGSFIFTPAGFDFKVHERFVL